MFHVIYFKSYHRIGGLENCIGGLEVTMRSYHRIGGLENNGC